MAGLITPLIAMAPGRRRGADNSLAAYFRDSADGAQRWQRMFMQTFVPGIDGRYRTLATGDTRSMLSILMGGMAASVYQLHHFSSFAGIAALSSSFRIDGYLLGPDRSRVHDAFRHGFGSGLIGSDRLTAE
ncbi:hypothetical protein [Paracoccus sp. R86501]|uniref:hypothetical protein n=1 Tax=Paracoccus sp. R86501 TaxID=3101711 RepID=UPI00366B4386